VVASDAVATAATSAPRRPVAPRSRRRRRRLERRGSSLLLVRALAASLPPGNVASRSRLYAAPRSLDHPRLAQASGNRLAANQLRRRFGQSQEVDRSAISFSLCHHSAHLRRSPCSGTGRVTRAPLQRVCRPIHVLARHRERGRLARLLRVPARAPRASWPPSPGIARSPAMIVNPSPPRGRERHRLYDPVLLTDSPLAHLLFANSRRV